MTFEETKEIISNNLKDSHCNNYSILFIYDNFSIIFNSDFYKNQILILKKIIFYMIKTIEKNKICYFPFVAEELNENTIVFFFLSILTILRSKDDKLKKFLKIEDFLSNDEISLIHCLSTK